MKRGEIWWASLPAPVGSEPGYRRPVLVVSSDDFNETHIKTLLCVALTSNARLAAAPGNVLIPAVEAGLDRDSVANVSQLVTVNKSMLTDRIGHLGTRRLAAVDAGLRLVLAL
ncbi:MAG: type II toxin-antitoxin system PemK/MazF family toxin [Deltaproteobacteria bacterium]|nr:type II toxin-antitoxin system PemK/MazF family toxin [Deltaproteobacteria bacterium]